MEDKRIDVCYRTARQLKTNFGNPRKITKKKREELERSLREDGDFGVIVIDEDENIISGNQRVKAYWEINPDEEFLCKKLIGYSESEKRVINIKANTHAGEWDLDMLAEWQADLTRDLGIDPKETSLEKRKIENMEPVRYEKYDYVLIACRNEIDYGNLTRALGIDDKKVLVAKKRKINARAIWYDDMKAQIIRKDGLPI